MYLHDHNVKSRGVSGPQREPRFHKVLLFKLILIFLEQRGDRIKNDFDLRSKNTPYFLLGESIQRTYKIQKKIVVVSISN